MLNAVVTLESLRVPPGNALESLKGDRRGQHSLRINEQFRLCFVWAALEEFLKPLGMSQVELAERIGVSFPRVNELIHGKRGVTPDTALRLERLFGMEAQFWLNLQLAWDLYHAGRSPAAKAIRKIRRLPALAATGAD
jgi:addiction module HigA family antidote